MIGLLVKSAGSFFESKEYILIANRIASIYEENQEYSGVMKIPTTWIKKRVSLSEYVK